ncbi:protein lingerer isoform X1 [Sitophilus oryzae]|uniref:Protein lingerer isoform X1 n=1 Tax=Sitophilus oryzae TaxID=7048 RepID=A0A6J2Y8H3_SITOR|nr:protein lingerer isoform X1 [Sitophilus oryzae]XP_030759445.1 protein lingerer isoform X1 [Sitophilus oryzae]
MSSTGRTTSKGGKGAKADKTHKSDGGKGGGDKVHKEQSSKNEELSMKEKVKQLIELTNRSEEEVCLALHESNNDINIAINMLYEEMAIGEWETKDKKKKKRQASASKQDKKAEEGLGGDSWDDETPPRGNNAGAGDVKERGGDRRSKDTKPSGGPPPRRNQDGRGGWRGGRDRDRDHNDEGGRDRDRGGDRDQRRGQRGTGGPRGGGRGRGGGRAGGRYQPRGGRGGSRDGTRDYNKQPIDTWDSSNTWDNSTVAAANTNHTGTDDWDDLQTDEWSTEEYTGSLMETKVFTPSVQPSLNVIEGSQEQSLEPSLPVPSPPDVTAGYSQALGQTYNQTVQLPSQSPVQPLVNTLTPAQSQYFSQLAQQNSDSLNKQYSNATYQSQTGYDTKSNVQQAYTPSTQPYNSAAQPSYGAAPSNTYANSTYQPVTNSYGSPPEAQPAQQSTRTKTQRARVPPPSKIPSSAVEMPGDLNSSIGYLDVQFGAMDLIDNSFDSTTASDVKYGSESNRSGSGLDSSPAGPGTLDLATAQASASAGLDGYSSNKSANQSSISSTLTQSLSNSESIPQTSEHMTYNNATTNRSPAQVSVTQGAVPTVTAPSGLDLNKQATDNSHSYSSQGSNYNSYQSKANTYSTSPYNSTQTTASSYVNPAANYVNNQASSYAAQNANSYQNSYSSSASYQNASQGSTGYPSVTQANSYQSSQNYQTPNPVYGANSGLSNNSNYGGTTTSQYNSYGSTTSNHKLGKENSYDTGNSASASSTANTTSNNATSASTLPQTTISSSKSAAALNKNSSNNVVSNIPPGVTPVMSTPYIMGQVPYFQQPVYSYEDMQLLQQRLPHMTTPYFDMGYQTPTTLAAVRGDPTGALGAYSTISADGRYATAQAQATGAGGRGEGNTSPVPSSTLAAAVQSQQASTLTAQQGHQGQPILAAGTGPPYFFATAFNPLAAAPNYAQFGTMYTQLPAVTNAHGSSTSSQYGPKPATYGSASYGAYDALGQSAQDYAKGGYNVGAAAAAAAAQQVQKGQGNSTTGGSGANDLSAMYGKPHAAIGKVNSYEKQSFHSGTPPPFTGALHGSQNAGLAPSGTGYAPQVYIPAMAPQHHSTMAMHQPLHQMDVRHQGRRVDSGNSAGQRSQGSNQAKSGSKQTYGTSYWNQN